MESYTGINNDFIKNNKRLFKQKVIKPFDNQPNGNPLNKTFSTKLDFNNDDLSTLWIRTSLVFQTNITGVNQYNAGNLFKTIIVRQISTNIEICNLSNRYQTFRAQQLNGLDIGDFLEAGNFTPGTNTGTVETLLFASFSESPNSTLPTKYLNDIEVVCTFNDTLVNCGFTGGTLITSCSLELIGLYFNNLKDDKPKSLVNSYNVYYEQTQPLGALALDQTGEINVVLTCPFPSFNVCVYLVKDDSLVSGTIGKLTFTTNNNKFIESDNYLNYTLYDRVNHYNASSVFCHWNTPEKRRDTNDGLLVYSSSMRQTVLTINYTAASAGNYSLYIFMEYRTNHLINNGKLEHNTTAMGSLLYT